MAEVCGALTALRALDVSYCWCTLPLHSLLGCCRTAALAAFAQGCCADARHLNVFFYICIVPNECTVGLRYTPCRPGIAARVTRSRAVLAAGLKALIIVMPCGAAS